MSRIGRFAHLLVAAVPAVSTAVIGLAGCATTTVAPRNGPSDCATAAACVPADAVPLVVRSKGFGLFRSDTGFSLGWLSELKVYLVGSGDGCRLVLIVQHPEDLGELRSLLQAVGSDLDRVCTVTEGA